MYVEQCLACLSSFTPMDVQNVDIMTGEKLSSIKVAMDNIYKLVRSSSRRGGGKGGGWGDRYFSKLRVSLY